MTEITIDMVRKRAEADAKTYGYHLCPCRLASGKFELDRDIICPCDYRDPDVTEYGACYCRLYVNTDVYEGKKELPTVPERRPLEKQSRVYTATVETKAAAEKKPATAVAEKKEAPAKTKPKLWYCKQCGYVVFRDDPPYVCPICKAKKEMFAEIKIRIDFIE